MPNTQVFKAKPRKNVFCFWRLEAFGVPIIQIRIYSPSDYFEIANLFHESIHAIPDSIYTTDEKKAWAPSPPDYEAWRKRLEIKKPFVATMKSRIVGFIELEADGHIDCLYVHKDNQQVGVASALLTFVCDIAKERGYETLYVEASKVALPLFLKHGFRLESDNAIQLHGQTLTNYSMRTEI